MYGAGGAGGYTPQMQQQPRFNPQQSVVPYGSSPGGYGMAPPPGYGGFVRPGSAGAGYGYGGFGQMAGGYTPAGKPAPVTTGDEEEGGAEDGEEEGEKVAPLVTCRLVCCYTLLLLIGYSIGMVANELHWASLKKIHPWLEDLESWLHKPHDDPDHGGMYCSDGLFIPGPARTGANTLIFLTLLCWSFLGVAIAADVFMAGIEKITSEETTRTVVLPSGEVRRYTITVWNATIANLTLMALGSSAPEILLSCIEIGSSGFYAGELGPSTIVGSAAFNMLVISAVCVIAIPDGGSRHIKELPVFYITAAFSLVAYVWLIVILQVVTPNIVDVWEGLVTLIAFPLLVYVAYQVGSSLPAAPSLQLPPCCWPLLLALAAATPWPCRCGCPANACRAAESTQMPSRCLSIRCCLPLLPSAIACRC